MKRNLSRTPIVLCAAVLMVCLLTVAASAQSNIAPSGKGYTWHSMTSSTATSHQTAATGINDGNLTTGVYCNPNNVTPNEWEGAGVIFSSAQTVSSVVLYNGVTDSNGNGYLEANITLESSTNGTSWSTVSGWSLSPAYGYNGSASGQTYTFSGPAISGVKGIRIVGQVYVAGYSWNWVVNEIKIFASSSPTPTPTPTATPKATATPTTTPKTTPTPTAKPTATATPKPTATPTATATGDGSTWKGHNWNITNGGMAGVANGNPANIFVDQNGYLHLQIINRSGTYTASEMFSADNMGFGTYQWQIEGSIDNMDKSTVLGLFPYGPAAGIGVDGENELDIEFSKWDNTCGGCNADFTFYPSTGNAGIGPQEDDFTFSLSGGTLTTARLVWSSTSVTGTIMSGLQPIGTTQNVLRTYTISPSNYNAAIPQTALPLGMNFWCFQSLPASNQSVIIHDFQYVPQ